MRVSAGTEYSVQAVAHLAEAYGNGPVPLSRLAEEEEIPLPFLEQLMLVLRRKGLVTSVRGARGGYSLAKRPGEISVGDIMTAVEGPFVSARNVWAMVQKKVIDTLNSVTLADLSPLQPVASGRRSHQQLTDERPSLTTSETQDELMIQDVQVAVETGKGNNPVVEKGEVRAVMRPNGSGKSSLWRRKACPKCGGDMYRDPLLGEEWELNCLQCGHIVPKAQAQAGELTNSRAKGDSAFPAPHRQDERMPK